MNTAPKRARTSAFRVDREDQSLLLKTIASLRKAILSQHFRPGDRLVERELCELTGVSRGSVREALRHLQAEGLVLNEPHRGQTVASLDKEIAHEIYQIRGVLEPLAARLCVEKASEAQVRELDAAACRFADAVRAGDCFEVVEVLTDFYKLLFDASGNRTAAAIARTLHVRVSSLRTLTFQRQTPADAERSIKNIAEIARLIGKRNAAAAENACSKQVERSRKVAMRILDQLTSDARDVASPTENQIVKQSDMTYRRRP